MGQFQFQQLNTLVLMGHTPITMLKVGILGFNFTSIKFDDKVGMAVAKSTKTRVVVISCFADSVCHVNLRKLNHAVAY